MAHSSAAGSGEHSPDDGLTVTCGWTEGALFKRPNQAWRISVPKLLPGMLPHGFMACDFARPIPRGLADGFTLRAQSLAAAPCVTVEGKEPSCSRVADRGAVPCTRSVSWRTRNAWAKDAAGRSAGPSRSQLARNRSECRRRQTALRP